MKPEARLDLLAGLRSAEVCRRAKEQARFAGAIRTNLISMLDGVGLPGCLGLSGSEALFSTHGSLLHTTSMLCSLRPAPTCTPQPLAPTCAPQLPAPTRAVQPLASTHISQPLGSLVQYSDDGLGFAVQVPSGWEIARSQELQGIAGFRGGVGFQSNLYAHDSQVFGRYSVGVAVGEARFGVLTDTVQYRLSSIVPEVRERIRQRCCFEVGGEPAIELTNMPGERWGSRVLIVLHDGQMYSFRFHPYEFNLDLPSDAAAWEAFDLFLRTFTFIPVTVSPRAPVSPVPTPPP